MKYMGSKNRIAKDILNVILKDRKENQYYIEPFVGGANMIDKVTGNRIGSDNNLYIIEMWKGLQQNKNKPLEIPKELYSKARSEFNNNTNIEFDNFLIGWIGWMGSFNGRFFDGGYSGKTKTRDYVDEQIRNTLKQIPNILDVNFIHSSYDKLEIPNDSIVYCDPPYQGTKQYSTSKDFNYDNFWEWCRKISKNNKIFISEYNAPEDFKCIWSKEVTNSMNTTLTYKPIEKLFTI
jgi:DNA adenine methylase